MTPKAKTARPRKKDTGSPNPDGDEQSTLLGLLDDLRDAVAAKLKAAPQPQVRQPAVASDTKPAGLGDASDLGRSLAFLGQAGSSNLRKNDAILQ